ncbi:MAG: beta-N-acetylhexosaminidase [Bacteroidales bacterium]|nr:beta-N-acetylhexosaminidase [Bacteroidales bacterium]
MKKLISSKLWSIIRSAIMYVVLIILSTNANAVEKPLIFPIPQQLEVTSEIFELDETVSIIVPENYSEEDIFLARFLVRELSDKYGIAVKIESSAIIPEGRKVVVMGSVDNPLIKQYIKDNKLKMSTDYSGSEGYFLNVSNNKIVISGLDDSGAFFGLQSLRQLIDAENGTKVQGVKVQDWPNLPFRAIRLYVPGPENIAFFKRFLRDFMALYKYNKVIIEVNCMRLDNHPEVNAGWIEFAKDLQYSRSNRPVGIRGEGKTSSHYDAGDGLIIEKDDIRDIVELANQNFIEVIPEIPSLTHAYYLLTRHPELSEYPGDNWPDTYCPSNPASYELMFDVYDEYIEVMQPKMIHIGHDEWRMPLDVCPLCKEKTYSELYVQDVNNIYNYMSEKGIKIAMWGDHLLESVRNAGPRDAVSSTGFEYQKPGAVPPSLVKSSIPKDILIFNWFWVNEERDMELQDLGFKQLYGNFKPNISNWDERIKKIDVVGGAPSSWAATNEFNFGKDLLVDFLGSANLLWSTHTVDQTDVAAIARGLMPSIRTNLGLAWVPSEDENSVEPIDITSNFNFPANSEVFNVNLSTLKYGSVNNRAKVFNLSGASTPTSNCAIAVGSIGVGENPLPNEVKGISIEEDVSSLIFLHAAALPAGNQKAYYNIPNFFDTPDLLGFYEILYEDGFRISVPIQYGVNILEWNPGGENSLDRREGRTGSPQNAYCYKADPISCSSNEEANPITFYAYEWVNPRYGKIIKEVSLFGTVDYQATQPAGNPEFRPMKSNAILLTGISKVKKRIPYRATKE